MKLKLVTAIAISAMAILSCSEDTGTIGTSLTFESDLLDLEADIFKAYSRSVAADSVYVRDFDSYIGIVKDPETNSYVKSEFMTQFNMLENYPLPDKNKLVMKPGDSINVDTCEIWLYFDESKCYGDTLTPVKINLLEMSKPMSETKTYYSNYDPVAEGYIRTDGLKKSISFTLNNLTYKDSVRNLTSYVEKVRIPLNQAYTDKNGKTYSNYVPVSIANKVDNCPANTVVYRFADVLLMRAEAKVRLGESGQEDFDRVRERAGMERRPCTLENLLDERMLELCWEGWRRQDLIRFGKYRSLYDGPDAIDESDGHTTVFPIPGDVRTLNPNIPQNKGY